MDALLLVGLLRGGVRCGTGRFVHARHRHRLVVSHVIANAVHRAQFGIEAFRQGARLLCGIGNRRFTRLIFVAVCVSHAQLNRTNLIQARLQRAVQQLIQLIQLAQRHFHLTHRTVAFQHRFTLFGVVILRLGAEISRINIFLLDAVLLQEIKILRHAVVSLFFCIRRVFRRNIHHDGERSHIRTGIHAGLS